VETSSKAFSVSLFREREEANIEIVREVTHSQNIVSTVDFLLRSFGRSMDDIGEVYAGKGPGSFTGIRIGLSFANTVCQTKDIPVMGISSLDLLAFEAGEWKEPVVPFLISRKNEVYTAYYGEEARLSDYLALRKDDFLDFIESHNPHYLVASEEDDQKLSLEGEKIRNIKKVHAFPKARTMYPYVLRRGLKPEKSYVKPLYVRGI
jgi:tRNA threonylcarbamoyladenosine biosynthesis protein TsaB